MVSDPQTSIRPPRLVTLLAIVSAVWLAMFIMALTGSHDLLDNEQRIISYALDVLHNGNWMVQHDERGEIASKPPLLTWLVALCTLPFGRINLFSLYLPSALAALGTAWLILAVGRAHFGWLAGFCGALAFLISSIGDDQMATARYDALFALPLTLGALAAFQAWKSGRGWTWFWVAAGVAALVKGPLSLLLAGGGLLAVWWERRAPEKWPLRGSHWLGVILFLLIPGGWFALGYHEAGYALVDKLIGRELVQQNLTDKGGHMGIGFYCPTLNFFWLFFPASIFAALAFWRVWRYPAVDIEGRRFERFLFCWFFFGLVIFSLAAHQRSRLIIPLMPAAALLAGREIARWLQKTTAATICRWLAVMTALGLGVMALNHYKLISLKRRARETQALKTLAMKVREQGGENFPLTYVDGSFVIQFYLNTYRAWVKPERAEEILREDAAAFVVIENGFEELQAALQPTVPLHELLHAPMTDGRVVRIISNHPRLEWTEHMVMMVGPLRLRLDGTRLISVRNGEFIFERKSVMGGVTVVNLSDSAQVVRVRFASDASGKQEKRTMSPGESWRF